MSACVKCKSDLPEAAVFCPACGKKQCTEQKKYKKRANGTGNISKLSGKRAKPWLARKNGVAVGTYATRAEAQKALERYTDTDVNDKHNLTFAQIYEAWKPVHAREVTASQMGAYSAAYKHCQPLHDRKFRTLRKSDFQSVILTLEANGKSKSTCEKVLQLFGQLSKWAIDECIIQTNHAQNVRTTAQQKSTRQPFRDADIQAMQKSTNPAADIALILIGTGARPGELFSVPLVNCHENYFIGGSKTDAGKNRVIPVSPIGLEAYTKLRAAAIAGKHQLLIDAYEGNRTAANYTKRDFKGLMEEIGCTGMTTYNCRHTFITLAVNAGVPQSQLMQIVGHVDKETTDKYTHMDAQDLVSAVAGVGGTLTVCNKSATRSASKKSKPRKSS